MSNDTSPKNGSTKPKLDDVADLVIAAVVVLWVYIVPFDQSSVNILRVLPGLIGLLLIPGYLTIVSALVVTGSEVELDRLEVLLISFVISVTIVPALGVSLHFITGNADPETIVGIISVYVVISVLSNLVYRFVSDSTNARVTLLNVREFCNNLFRQETNVDTVLNMAIVLLVLAGTVAVMSPVSEQSSPQFTELGLVTQNESGELAMEGYLSDLPSTESRTIYAEITNKERQVVNYSLIVQIQQTELRDQSVAALERRQTVRTNIQLSHNESKQIPYRVTARDTQTGCRVAFLLYSGDVPELPTMDNADREVHLWHTDDPPPANNGCRDLNGITVQQMPS